MKKLTLLTAALLAGLVHGAPAPKQSDYYTFTRVPIPADVSLEASGLAMLPNGKLAVSTRRGDIFTVSNPLGKADDMKLKLYASGLHEPIGIHWNDGWLYATQRCEVTRIKDEDGDGRGDVFETVSDGWAITGDYHEYAFGSQFDKDGNMWVVLCLTGSFNSNTPYRGWCVRVNKKGEMIPTASGIRSPGGIGLNHEGEVFYADNQGPWNGSSCIKHLTAGSFQSHPASYKWWNLPLVKKHMGPKPPVTPNSDSRIPKERARVKEYVPPACVLPHGKLGNSTSGFAFASNDKFGPFKNQLLVSDQSHSNVSRVILEKVNGVYQGAAILFMTGFGSGNIPSFYHESGALFVGGSDRGWGARGGKRFALDRVNWTGKVPFEVHEMRAKSDGFELTFTHDVDPKTAGDVASYSMKAWTYVLRAQYGSPEVDHATPKITGVTVGKDNKTVRLKVEGLVKGHVHHLVSGGVRSKDGLPLLHPNAYYTLNEIPKK